MRSLKLIVTLAGLIGLLASPAFGQQTLDFPLSGPQPFSLDSGVVQNTSRSPNTVFQDRVEMAGAAWMRLYFGDVELGRGSFIRITSLLDGEVQELDADALLEALTSEYASRRFAMKNATDAATDMQKVLRVIYNRKRQENITKELLDIVGGAEAVR